ncbi:MAG: beta-eliminating lyase-related protein [Bacteroidota bacterium]
MSELNRRDFVKLSGASALGVPFLSFSNTGSELLLNNTQQKVKFTRDGIDFSPEEYAALLSKLMTKTKLVPDSYSRGGVVEGLEKKFANLLGKESAVFMPTGTLANQIAIRKLAGNRKKVIVQAESHIYNDSGDCAQNLSGLNLIPLAEGKTTFTLDEVKAAIRRTNNGRVKTDVGAIMIESPVRRTDNEMFDYDEMKKISEFARQNNIKIHLDGARLFNAVAHSEISVKEFSSLFDTVYISMYKNFNAASGAILAGSKEFCKELYHTRRMFGGGMPQVWPFALVALNYSDSFLPEYKKAMLQFNKFNSLISKEKQFKIEKVANGTNVFKLYVETENIDKFRENLINENVVLPKPVTRNMFKLKINTTLNNMPAELLVSIFKRSV